MSIELQVVAGSVLILFGLLMYQGALVPLNQGFGWGLGSRDGEPNYTAMQGRARRTVANHVEGMLLFIPLVMIVEMAALSSQLTEIGAAIYLAGRLAYAPLYLLGVSYLRSLFWGIALLGTVLLGYEVVIALIGA